MRTGDLDAAAQEVVAARLGRRRLGRLEGATTLEDGYAVQGRANAVLAASLGPVVGHKIGGTTAAMRRYLNLPEPIAGEIFATTVVADGATVRRQDYLRLGIETEIAVRLGRTLSASAAPYGREEVADVVAAVMAAIELVDDRYEDFVAVGPATVIADNAFDAGSILGPELEDWRALDLGCLQARTLRDGAIVAEGLSDSLYGHPLDALAWLANRRAALGLDLPAGTFVSLGSITPVQWVDTPGKFAIEVEALGGLTVRVA